MMCKKSLSFCFFVFLLLGFFSSPLFSETLNEQLFSEVTRKGPVDLQAVENLLVRGADPNYIDQGGMNLMMVACNRRNLPLIHLLAGHGADIHSSPVDGGVTPLMAACFNNDFTRTLEESPGFFSFMFGTGTNSFSYELRNGKKVAIDMQLMDTFTREDLRKTDDRGNTALHYLSLAKQLWGFGGTIYGEVESLKGIAADTLRQDMEILIRNGADVNARNKAGKTPLFMASEHGRPLRVYVLMDNGAKPGIRDNEGNRAYEKTRHQLIQSLLTKNDTELAEKMLSGEISGKDEINEALILMGNPGFYIEENKRFIEIVCEKQMWDLAEILIDSGINCRFYSSKNPSSGPIHFASYYGQLDLVKKIIEHGEDLNNMAKDGVTPLLLATRAGHTDIMTYLLDNGAKIDYSDEKYYEGDYQPIHEAVMVQNKEAVELLLEYGADVNSVNSDGDTPLFTAVRYCDDPAMVNMLILAGADVNYKNSEGISPLKYAAVYNQNPEILRVLLDSGAEMNAKDEDGFTPIHSAVLNDNPEVLQFLIDEGADVNIRSDNGSTPLMEACWKAKPLDFLKVLIQNGADVRAVNEQKMTALMYAAKYYDSVEVFEYLIGKGSKVKARNNQKQTALMYAAQYSSEEVIRFLLDHRPWRLFGYKDKDKRKASDYLLENKTLPFDESSELYSLLD